MGALKPEMTWCSESFMETLDETLDETLEEKHRESLDIWEFWARKLLMENAGLRPLEKDLERVGGEITQAQKENSAVAESLPGFQAQSSERMKDFHDRIKVLQQDHKAADSQDWKEVAAQLETSVRHLENQLATEQEANASLKLQNDQLKKSLCAIVPIHSPQQTTAEQEEEFIANTLMRRISELQKDKQDLLLKLEAEEEMITNQLQRKLSQLQKDKIQMEISLEQEQEHMVNRLQKQLDELRDSNRRRPGSDSKSTTSSKQGSSIDLPPASNAVIEILKAESNELRTKLSDQTAHVEAWAAEVSQLYVNLYQKTKTLGIVADEEWASIPPHLPSVGTLIQISEPVSPLPFSRSSSASPSHSGIPTLLSRRTSAARGTI